jgi:hypothetical protein
MGAIKLSNGALFVVIVSKEDEYEYVGWSL